MKLVALAVFVLGALTIQNTIAQKKLIQNIEFEIGCVDDVHVKGDNIYAATSKGIQVYDNGTWGDIIEISSGFSSNGSVTVDDNGVIWYSNSKGLYSYDNGTIEQHMSTDSDIPSDDFKALHYHEDTLWLVETRNLIRKTGDSYEIVEAFSGAFAFLGASEITSDGNMLVSSGNQLAVITGNQIRKKNFPGGIKYLFMEEDGNVIVTSPSTIYRFNPATLNAEELYASSNVEFDLAAIDNQGSIYIVLSNTNLLMIDQDMQVCEFEAFNIDEPNFKGFFYSSDTTLMTFGLNVNGSAEECSVITSFGGVAVDNDNDGFYSDVDCDDDDPEINPDTEEIPGNGIDENCDGLDTISSTDELSADIFSIRPNPVADLLQLFIESNSEFSLLIYSSNGALMYSGVNVREVDVSQWPEGIYGLELKDMKSGQRIYDKFVVHK